jgi:hypothetical protein
MLRQKKNKQVQGKFVDEGRPIFIIAPIPFAPTFRSARSKNTMSEHFDNTIEYFRGAGFDFKKERQGFYDF